MHISVNIVLQTGCLLPSAGLPHTIRSIFMYRDHFYEIKWSPQVGFRNARDFSLMSAVLDDSGLDSQALQAPSFSPHRGASLHGSENPRGANPSAQPRMRSGCRLAQAVGKTRLGAAPWRKVTWWFPLPLVHLVPATAHGSEVRVPRPLAWDQPFLPLMLCSLC